LTLLVENFGEYLRTLRLEKRYSLREVEELSGISNSYLGLIELAFRIARAFDVPLEEVFQYQD